MTSVASFGSISRINIDNPNSFSESFVFNKASQLEESPFMNPLIVFSSLSDINQIFHYYNISLIQWFNNTFTDVMISPSHQLSPSARNLSEFSLSRFCAFSLDFTNQFIMPDPLLLNLLSEEFVVTCHSKIIYSEINTKNPELLIRDFCADLFGETEIKKTSSPFVNVQNAFTNSPVLKINLIAFRDLEWNLDPALYCRKTQNIILETSTPREVIFHEREINNRFGFGFFDNPTGLFNTCNSQLTLQSTFFKSFVNKGMQSNIIFNPQFPSRIYTELQTFSIEANSFYNFRSSFNLNFCSCPNQHLNYQDLNIYKLNKGAIPPHSKLMGYPCQ